MSTGPARLFVLVGDQAACIKISGRANFTSSIDFRTVIDELRQKGYQCFVLDLSECTLMDSTFLGVLAGFGLKMSQPRDGSPPRLIELLNPNARITELLENLGVLHLFHLSHGPTPGGAAEALAHVPCAPSKEDVTRTCLEAHRTLIEANPANAAKFKEVTQFLAEDLKKLKALQTAPPSPGGTSLS